MAGKGGGRPTNDGYTPLTKPQTVGEQATYTPPTQQMPSPPPPKK